MAMSFQFLDSQCYYGNVLTVLPQSVLLWQCHYSSSTVSATMAMSLQFYQSVLLWQCPYSSSTVSVTIWLATCPYNVNQSSHGSLKPLKSLEFILAPWTPGNSLAFWVKTLNPLEICERHKKIDLFKFHTVLSSTAFQENHWCLL